MLKPQIGPRLNSRGLVAILQVLKRKFVIMWILVSIMIMHFQGTFKQSAKMCAITICKHSEDLMAVELFSGCSSVVRGFRSLSCISDFAISEIMESWRLAQKAPFLTFPFYMERTLFAGLNTRSKPCTCICVQGARGTYACLGLKGARFGVV